MSAYGEQRVKAGGVDMPAKTDPYDWTTPSGSMPVVLSGKRAFKAFQDAGFDMRWYVVTKPLPTK